MQRRNTLMCPQPAKSPRCHKRSVAVGVTQRSDQAVNVGEAGGRLAGSPHVLHGPFG